MHFLRDMKFLIIIIIHTNETMDYRSPTEWGWRYILVCIDYTWYSS